MGRPEQSPKPACEGGCSPSSHPRTSMAFHRQGARRQVWLKGVGASGTTSSTGVWSPATPPPAKEAQQPQHGQNTGKHSEGAAVQGKETPHNPVQGWKWKYSSYMLVLLIPLQPPALGAPTPRAHLPGPSDSIRDQSTEVVAVTGGAFTSIPFLILTCLP